MRTVKTEVENRLICSVVDVNAQFTTMRSFPPMFTLWDAKTDRFYSEARQSNVKTRAE